MRRPIGIAALVCGIALASAWSASGQRPPAPPDARPGPGRASDPRVIRVPGMIPAPSRPADPLETKLAEARGLIRLGKQDEAIAKLRPLYQQYPSEWRVVQLLGWALAAKEDRAGAIALYLEAAGRVPEPMMPLVEAERLSREGDDWTQALQLCLDIRERFPDAQAWVSDELESLIRTDRIGEAAMQALEDAVRKHPGDRTLQELAIQGLLFHGRTDRAVEQAAALDREQKARGATLLRVSRLAADKGNPDAALAGYDRILKEYPDSPVKDEVLFLRAEALRAAGRAQESLAAYDAASGAAPGKGIGKASGSSPFAARARLEKARVLANDLHRTQQALEAYQAVLQDLGPRPDPHAAEEVRLAMADCYVSLGNPAEATKLYAALADSANGAADPKVRAQAMFQVGEMLFYQGKLKEANDAWYKLADRAPRSPVVNNALERILLLGEKSDNGGVPVTALGQAEYQRRLGNMEKGLKLVDDAVGQFPASRAVDALERERVLLLLDLGRLDEARTAADTLASRFPESPLASRTLFELAGRIAATPDGAASARSIYMMILLHFPDSLEAADARSALQKMEQARAGPGKPDNGKDHSG